MTTIKRKLIPEENKIEICHLYQTGLGSDTIAKQFDIHPNTVLKILKKNGIKTRDWKRKIPLKEHVNICALYKEGKSAPKIADQYRVSQAIILKILKKSDVKRRSAEEAHRIYPIQEDFFDEIDTEEKAYMLGFFYADGCNSSNEKTISIDLNIKDKDILIKFANLIYLDNNPETHVHIYDRRKEGRGISAVLNIHSKHISKQIKNLGAPQRKTFKIEFPDWLDQKLIRHFIRGYFDGDGSVSFKKSITNFKITSNDMFSKNLVNILKHQLNVYVTRYQDQRSKGAYNVTISGNRQVYRFLRWVYHDSNIYLERKLNIYHNIRLKLNETNKLMQAGTQGYSKTILEKYDTKLDCVD